MFQEMMEQQAAARTKSQQIEQAVAAKPGSGVSCGSTGWITRKQGSLGFR